MSAKRKPARAKLANQAGRGYNELLQSLVRIAAGVEGISTAVNKPENKLKKVLELAGGAVAVFGVVQVADIIRSWIMGG